MTYHAQYRNSLENPDGFWAQAAQAISWERPYDEVLDEKGRWFSGGRLNTCYNCVDRHVEQGRGQQAAIVYDSPVTRQKLVISYAQLLEQVARFAGLLTSLGVARGDRVLLSMPMTPETLIAMHACARIGAIHVVIFGGFAPQELASRLEHATPRVVVTASCGIEGQRIVEYKPNSTELSKSPAISLRPAWCCSDPSSRALC